MTRSHACGLAFVKRAIAGRARANAGNVEESVNSPESFQARGNRILDCKLIADIGGCVTRLTQFCRNGTCIRLSLRPTTNTGLSAPHKRAVAAAIPDDPVTRRTSFTVPIQISV